MLGTLSNGIGLSAQLDLGGEAIENDVHRLEHTEKLFQSQAFSADVPPNPSIPISPLAGTILAYQLFSSSDCNACLALSLRKRLAFQLDL